MSDMRKIIVFLIENTDNADEGADLIMKLFARQPEERPTPQPETKASATDTPPVRRRRRRSTIEAASDPILPALMPDAFYSVDVMAQQTGYSRSNCSLLIQTNKVESRLEAGRRLILGADISRLRKARAAVRATNGSAETAQEPTVIS